MSIELVALILFTAAVAVAGVPSLFVVLTAPRCPKCRTRKVVEDWHPDRFRCWECGHFWPK